MKKSEILFFLKIITVLYEKQTKLRQLDHSRVGHAHSIETQKVLTDQKVPLQLLAISL